MNEEAINQEGGGISTGRSDAATAASKGKRGRGFLVEFFRPKLFGSK